MDNYDRFADRYEAYARNDGMTEIELGHKVVARLLGNRIKRAILDYGCGPGNFTRFLRSCGATAVGVDVSAKQIESAKSCADGISYHVIESADLGGLPSGFDAITFSFVLLTISDKEEIVKILAACRKKIASDGRLAILNADFEKSAGRNFVSYAIDRIDNPKSGDRIGVRLGRDRALSVNNYYWTVADYEEMLARAGFIMENVERPLATEGDGWLDEKEYPATIIMVARPA
jgi:SAM-dependent methyltransferase